MLVGAVRVPQRKASFSFFCGKASVLRKAQPVSALELCVPGGEESALFTLCLNQHCSSARSIHVYAPRDITKGTDTPPMTLLVKTSTATRLQQL